MISKWRSLESKNGMLVMAQKEIQMLFDVMEWLHAQLVPKCKFGMNDK